MANRGAPAPSPAPRRGPPGPVLVLALGLLLLSAVAAAQPGLAAGDPALPAAAQGPFEAALAAADAAVASPHPWSPDAPAWRSALTAASAAVAAAPDHPAPHRLLFRTYVLVGWWVRAANAADDLRAAIEALAGADGEEGGAARVDPWVDADPPVPDGPPSRALLARAYAELGFSRYQAGALDAALDVYGRWLAALPDDPEALRWSGRLLLERDDPAGALPYWSRLVELMPDDEAAPYFLAAARLGIEVGPAASAAFRDGIVLYEAGDLAAAAERLEEARAAAPGFVDAHAWAGRVALEAGRPGDAAVRYRAAAALRPDDAGLAFFVRVSDTQRDFGVAAGRAFFEGLTAYAAGELERAGAAFERSVGANAAFVEAWAWLGRVRQEQGRYADAEAAWARVVALDPGDQRARAFLNLAREQRAYAGPGRVTAAAFAAGVAAFERADLEEAAARFREVVRADPASTLGWTWLGRVAYTVRDFATAAEAFTRALELTPDDEDVAWFAADAAARVAEAEAAEDGSP